MRVGFFGSFLVPDLSAHDTYIIHFIRPSCPRSLDYQFQYSPLYKKRKKKEKIKKTLKINQSNIKQEMESGWEDILRSPPLDFLVGPERKRFSIHSGALQSLSTLLDTHISSFEMSQSTGEPTQPIDWPTVDVATFLRFSQFVYTGDYNVPMPSSSSSAATRNEDENSGGSAQARSTFNRRVGPYHSLDSWYQVLRHYPHKRLVPGPGQGADQLQQTSQYELLSRFCCLPYLAAEDPYPDFDRTTLLAHARLYALATAWKIPTLRRLTLNAIYHLLRHGDFLYDRIADISALIDFAFDDFYGTEADDLSGSGISGGETLQGGDEPARNDMLCEMLTLYGACTYGLFLLHPSFPDVCNRHGEFTAGVLDHLGGGAEDESLLDADELLEAARAGADPRGQVDELVGGLAEMRTGEWGAEDFEAGAYEEWWSIFG
ncbi:hypothetical protein F4775DRAFT_180905 [Biscogniauxia sp. FL1348]|nr:hypothetical protein F4775DRAFT_180905 [Biscogniauxia sp. FL1348]